MNSEIKINNANELTVGMKLSVKCETPKKRLKYEWCEATLMQVNRIENDNINVIILNSDNIPRIENLMMSEQYIRWKVVNDKYKSSESNVQPKKKQKCEHSDCVKSIEVKELSIEVKELREELKTIKDTLKDSSKQDLYKYITDCINYKMNKEIQDKRSTSNDVLPYTSESSKQTKKIDCIMKGQKSCKGVMQGDLKVTHAKFVSLVHFFEPEYREKGKFTSEKCGKKIITHLKRNYGICQTCNKLDNKDNSHNQTMIDMDKRYRLCVVCKINEKAHTKSLPVCNGCNDIMYNNSKESFFKVLFEPLIHGLSKIHPEIKYICDTAFSSTNITRPDCVIRFDFNKEVNNSFKTYKCVIIIEKDENQHSGYEKNDNSKIKDLVLDESHDYIFVVRLNSNEYKRDDSGDVQSEPTILDRHIVLRCWVIWYILEVKIADFPRYVQLYLYYSQTKDKLEKLMFNGDIEKYGGLGFGYGAPEHKDKFKNYIYSLEPTEGFDLNTALSRKNYKETWGKHLLSNRQELKSVFKKYETFHLYKDWKIDDYRKLCSLI